MNTELVKNILNYIRENQDKAEESVYINHEAFNVSESEINKALIDIKENSLVQGLRIVKDAGEIKGVKQGRLRLTAYGKSFLQRH